MEIPRVLEYRRRNLDTGVELGPWVVTYGDGAKETSEFIKKVAEVLNRSSK
mgnify:CR=1 FL=1